MSRCALRAGKGEARRLKISLAAAQKRNWPNGWLVPFGLLLWREVPPDTLGWRCSVGIDGCWLALVRSVFMIGAQFAHNHGQLDTIFGPFARNDSRARTSHDGYRGRSPVV